MYKSCREYLYGISELFNPDKMFRTYTEYWWNPVEFRVFKLMNSFVIRFKWRKLFSEWNFHKYIDIITRYFDSVGINPRKFYSVMQFKSAEIQFIAEKIRENLNQIIIFPHCALERPSVFTERYWTNYVIL